MCEKCKNKNERARLLANATDVLRDAVVMRGTLIATQATQLVLIQIGTNDQPREIQLSHDEVMKSPTDPPFTSGWWGTPIRIKSDLCFNSILLAARELWKGDVKVYATSSPKRPFPDDEVWEVKEEHFE